jgi:hypothetical protein
MVILFSLLAIFFAYSVGWWLLSIPRILFKQPRLPVKRISTISLTLSIGLAFWFNIALDAGFMSIIVYLTVMVSAFNVFQLIGLYSYQLITGK